MTFSPNLLFVINLGGSICLLLWGSYTVRTAVEKAYSARIGGFLSGAAGSSRIGALVCGILSATLFQSATATVMLTASFITGGILSLGMAVVVILGADVGSAVATRILFLDLSFLPPLLLLVGLILDRFSRIWRRKQLGRIFIGLGLMLLAIQLMKQVVSPVTETSISDELLVVLQSALFAALIISALFTWMVHSSVAVILVVASMAQVGFLTPPLFIAVLLGANIGSGLIALFLVNRHHLETYSAAVANFLMRTSLALIAFLLSGHWMEYVPKLGAHPGLQVINLHIMFNLMLALIFAPLNNVIGDFTKGLLTARRSSRPGSEDLTPGSGLDPGLVTQPEMALSCARREAFRLADNTESLFRDAMLMFEADDQATIEQIVKGDEEINLRNKAIQRYLSETRRHLKDNENISEEFEAELDEVLRFATTMENIGDMVSHNLARQAIKRIHRGVVFSSVGFDELVAMHTETLNAVRLEINRFASTGKRKRKSVRKQIEAALQLGQESIAQHRLRLSQRNTSSISTSSIHQDTVRDFMQVAGLISNMDIS